MSRLHLVSWNVAGWRTALDEITRTTRQGPAARHFERDTSSVASNVLTLLVKGDPAVFAQSYAQNYALEVEDMVTMHFLDAGIRRIVFLFPSLFYFVSGLQMSGDLIKCPVHCNGIKPLLEFG